MARRAIASAAQLRELDGVWEKVSTELGDAVAFAVRQRPTDPLAAIVEQLSHHLPAGSTEALKAENAGLRAQVQELTLENEELKRGSSVRAVPGEEAAASPALQALRDQTQAVLAELKAKRAQEVVDPLQAAWEKASVGDKPWLLRKAKKEHFQEKESFVPLISECAAAILAGNRDFQKIYHAVYDVIRSGEADGMEAAQGAIAALGQAVRGDPKRLQQRDEAAEPATLLADAAGARPAFAEVVRCLSEATGARCVSISST